MERNQRRVRASLWVTASLTPLAVALTSGLAGDLDLTFNATGKVLTSFPPATAGALTDDVAYRVVVDSRGRTVTVGYTKNPNAFASDFAVARYNADGTLDRTFGAGGTVVTNIDDTRAFEVANAVAIDAQERIVVAGLTWVTLGQNGDIRKIAVARYNDDGSLDQAFGNGGKLALGFGETLPDHMGVGIVIDRLGRIIVGSRSRSAAGDFDFTLTALTDTGSLDSTYGVGGRVVTDFANAWCNTTTCPRTNDELVALALDSTGRVVAAGTTATGASVNFGLARYRADGALDPTFLSSFYPTRAGSFQPGLVADDLQIGLDSGSSDVLSAMTIHSLPANGGGFIDVIVCAGYRFSTATTTHLALKTYIDGLDYVGPLTFGFGGPNDAIGAVAGARYNTPSGIDDDIYIAGTSDSRDPNGDFVLARLKLNGGVLDPAFGSGGKVFTEFGNPGDLDNALALTVDADGRPIVAGTSAAGDYEDFAIARYKPLSAADLTLTKSGPATALPGDTITYTLTLSNAGPDAAQNVVVSDTLPAPLSFASCTASAGGQCAGSGNQRTVTFATMPSGGSASVTLRASVPLSIADGTPITNTATVSTVPADPSPSDNTSTVKTVIANRADLFLTQRVTKLANRQLGYTIDVQNLGSAAARSLVMNDPMPNGGTFVSVTAGPWSCVPLPVGSVGTLTCTLAELPSGATASVGFVAKATAPGSVDMANTASVSSAMFDPNAENNSATRVTRVSGK
jgi:uncharacterized repeat protein (TIGR01451 family)/uncharacterized delta-60 repeat protein